MLFVSLRPHLLTTTTSWHGRHLLASLSLFFAPNPTSDSVADIWPAWHIPHCVSPLFCALRILLFLCLCRCRCFVVATSLPLCVMLSACSFGCGVLGWGCGVGGCDLGDGSLCAGHIPPYPEACRRQPARFRKTSTAHITHTTVIAIAGAVARLRAAHDLVIVSTITTYETSEHALPKSLRFLPSIERHETLKNRCKTTPTTEPAGK